MNWTRTGGIVTYEEHEVEHDQVRLGAADSQRAPWITTSSGAGAIGIDGGVMTFAGDPQRAAALTASGTKSPASTHLPRPSFYRLNPNHCLSLARESETTRNIRKCQTNCSGMRNKKGSVPYSWSLGGVLISLPKAMSPYVDHWCLWRMASATPDLRLPSQPQGITAHWLVPNYTAWWQRHMCVNNLPRIALDSGEVRIRTRDLLIASPAS